MDVNSLNVLIEAILSYQLSRFDSRFKAYTFSTYAKEMIKNFLSGEHCEGVVIDINHAKRRGYWTFLKLLFNGNIQFFDLELIHKVFVQVRDIAIHNCELDVVIMEYILNHFKNNEKINELSIAPKDACQLSVKNALIKYKSKFDGLDINMTIEGDINLIMQRNHKLCT
eukprot:267431_1